MSAAMRLPMVATVVGTSAAVLSLTAIPSVREYLSRHLSSTVGRYSWRLLALLLALANLKNLPGMWHVRVLRGIIYQLYIQPHPQAPAHLFAPLVTTTRNSLYDCDYNLHKSNSTYFADLDVARAHLVSCIIRTGLARLNRGDEEGLHSETRATPGRYGLALGAVACFFHRQIEPLQQFDILTRVLAWDRKWLYIVSHLVPRGAVRPDHYTLQPWKKGSRGGKKGSRSLEPEELKKRIFATSVARYVFKKGRLTINPEVVLERSKLLPPRPSGVGFPPRAEAGDAAAAAGLDASSGAGSGERGDGDAWTWEDMEAERLRGLRLATHLESLGGAQGELKSEYVLGEYGDYW